VNKDIQKPPLAEPQTALRINEPPTALGKNRRQANEQKNRQTDKQKDVVIA